MLVRLLGLWAVLSLVACGGDAFTNASGGGADAGVDATSPDAGGAGGGDACVPQRCPDLHYSCGKANDGCGGTIDCGECHAANFTCSADHACACNAATCASLDFDCGQVPDGCGGTLSCGQCSGTETCGAQSPNRCGTGTCTPKTCQELGIQCNSASDGCGEVLDCGTCTSPDTCGGGGVAGQCGCSPTTCTTLGYACGSVGDGCGGTLNCGTCSGNATCDMSTHMCECTPEHTCASLGYTCGMYLDSCGVEENCGEGPTEMYPTVNPCALAQYPAYYSCCPSGVRPQGGSNDGGVTCAASGPPQPIPGDTCQAIGNSTSGVNSWCCQH